MQGRSQPLIILCFLAGLIGIAQGLGLIIRDCSITCNVGFRQAPLAFLALALASAPFVYYQVHAIRRWGVVRWRSRSILIAALGFIAFRLLLYFLFDAESRKLFGQDEHFWHWAIRLGYVAFYIWVDLIFAVLIANLFGMLQEHFQDSENYLAWLGATLYAGGLLGGFMAALGNDWLRAQFPGRFEYARDHLMIAMSFAIFLMLPLAAKIQKNRPALEDKASSEPDAMGIREALRLIRSDKLMSFMALGFFSSGIATVMLDYVFYWMLTTQGEGSDGFVETLAKFYIWMNGLSFLMISMGTARLIRRLGLGFALLALPVALLASTSYLLIRIALPVVFVIRILEEILWGTLYEPATERLLLRIDAKKYDRLRPVLEGLMTRIGFGCGALVILFLSFGIELSQFGMIAFLLAFHVVWIIVLLTLLVRMKAAAATKLVTNTAGSGT